MKSESPIEERLLSAMKKFIPEAVLTQQHKIGPYRCDFLLKYKSVKLVVEADGAAYHSSESQKEYDARRDSFMIDRGFKVVRFSGSRIVAQAHKCCEEISTILGIGIQAKKKPKVKKDKNSLRRRRQIKRSNKKKAVNEQLINSHEWKTESTNKSTRTSRIIPSIIML